ncbi:MAG: Ig domain-containing protein [Elusimicrobiota bacterium]
MKKSLSLLAIFIVSALLVSGCMLPIFGNNPPVIESSPKTTAAAGTLFTYQVILNEDASDNVVFSLTKYPEGMTINSSTGLISWTPEESQAGEHEVSVKVSDGWRKDTQQFSIEVSLKKLSSIGVLPEEISIEENNTESISSVTAYYDDGSSASIAKTDCDYQSSNTNRATVNIYGQIIGKNEGLATITVSYTEDDITKEDTVSVTVTNPPSGGG